MIIISDIKSAKNSQYFSIRKTRLCSVILCSLVFLFVLTTSFLLNLFQYYKISKLKLEITARDNELILFDRENSRMRQLIEEQKNQIAGISQEPIEIERNSVEISDIHLALEEIVRISQQFYLLKEEESSEIGTRFAQIAWMISLENYSATSEENLLTRVELASLSASQEKILYDNIPNGYPTEVKVITSPFGPRIHPLTKIQSFHKGVDLRARPGHKVFATANGIVSSANYTELSGNRIILQHNFGFETKYSHLKEINVNVGDIIHKGDLIGLSGNTGRSSAPHLHYEIHYIGKAIDPNQFLKWELGSHDIFTQVRGIKWQSLINITNKQITNQTLQTSQQD